MVNPPEILRLPWALTAVELCLAAVKPLLQQYQMQKVTPPYEWAQSASDAEALTLATGENGSVTVTAWY